MQEQPQSNIVEVSSWGKKVYVTKATKVLYSKNN